MNMINHLIEVSFLFHFLGIDNGYKSNDDIAKAHILRLIAGVIWKGDKLIDGVPETLDMLRSKVCL